MGIKSCLVFLNWVTEINLKTIPKNVLKIGQWQCFCSVLMVHPGLTEGEEREVTEDNRKEGKEENPGEGIAFVVKMSPTWGCLREAEGPCAEVGGQKNDVCWVQCQQLPSHTDLVLICSKVKKEKKNEPQRVQIDTNQSSSNRFSSSCWRAAILTLLPD